MKGKWLAIGISIIAVILPLSPSTIAIKTISGEPVWITPNSKTQGIVFSDGFETYPDFNVDDFPPWSTYDGDGGQTKGIEGTDWPNEHYTGCFMIFNPTQTIPPLNITYYAHTGLKYMSCWDAVAAMAPNDDWLFTPILCSITFDNMTLWARSLNDEQGLEDFEIGVSTTDTDPLSFTILQTNNDIPMDWTEYRVNISAYSGQAIYIGIHVVSNDVFAFGLDDLEVTGSGVGPTDTTPPVTTCTLEGIFDGAVYISNVMVVLRATDTWSGVNTTKYRLDDGAWTDYAESFNVTNDGSHMILFYSVDNAGNQEMEKNTTFIILHQSLIEVTIKGGVGLSATIENTAAINLTNIHWMIVMEGTFILVGKTKNGTINSLPGGGSVAIKDFVIGFGPINIIMTIAIAYALLVSVTKTAFLLGPFVLAVK